MMQKYQIYLVPRVGKKRASHIWLEGDTACRMVSTGGLVRTDKYLAVDSLAPLNPPSYHYKLCAMCQNVKGE